MKLPEIKWLETAIKKIYSLGGKITQEELSDRLDIQAGLRRNIFSFFTQCLVGPPVPFGWACPEVVYVLIYLGLQPFCYYKLQLFKRNNNNRSVSVSFD
jgi:hypothetical protein